VLILVARKVERDAVLAAVRAANDTPYRLEFRERHTVFVLGEVGGVEVLLAQSGEQSPAGLAGPASGLPTAAGLLDSCRPEGLILAGTCSGLRDDQRPGDVLVSRRVLGIDDRAVVDGAAGEPAGTLADRLGAAAAGHRPPPALHSGLLLSAAAVGSPAELARLRQAYPDAVAAETEGAAGYAVAAAARVDWIVVKGIADPAADPRAGQQVLAAENAARFVVRMLQLASRDPMTEPHWS
jgi:adenosylhomocysteine nucleosidase